MTKIIYWSFKEIILFFIVHQQLPPPRVNFMLAVASAFA